MTKNEFTKQYEAIINRALTCAGIARREGILSLSPDREKAAQRDIFEYGLSFAVDGYAPELIDKILSNIVEQDKDQQTKTLKTMQKEAILQIIAGINTHILYAILNSYTNMPLDEATEPDTDGQYEGQD